VWWFVTAWAADGEREPAPRPDPAAALAVAATGCDAGDPAACLVVGQAVERTDPERAALALHKACVGGVLFGCVRQGTLLAAHDPRRALSVWRSTCRAEPDPDGAVARACLLASVTAASPANHEVYDPAAARALAARACALGEREACVSRP
jgi:hypothetical protein